MKFLKFYLIIFISLTSSVKADFNEKLINQLEDGGKLIFIRHAYAPGNGDPNNFNLNDCSTQRNLNSIGRKQATEIGEFFRVNKIKIHKVLSSEWCRCKETADIAFKKFETKQFLNSFYSPQYSKNRKQQVIDFKDFLKKWNEKDNLIFITHYVVISEFLNYAPSSGEIVIADKYLNIIDSFETKY